MAEQEIILMPLSHSRIQNFKKCPFSFKRLYIDKYKVTEKSDPLRVGSCVHEILEEIERYCLETTMINQYTASELAGNFTVTPPMAAFVKSKYNKVTRETFLKTVFNFPSIMSSMINLPSFYSKMDAADPAKFECVSIVSFVGEKMSGLMERKMTEHVIDTDHLRRDVMSMVERAVVENEFKRYPGEIIFLESEMAFNPSWKAVDWMDPTVAFRGKADKIIFNFSEKFISIVDYKTSRKAMSEEQATRDHQLKLYLAFMRRLYGQGFSSIRVVWDYVRLSKKVELIFNGEEIDKMAESAEAWVLENRQEINETIKSGSFPCKINEYCDDCVFRCSECTIFGGKSSTDIEKPDSFVIKSPENAKDVYVFIQALRYKADMLNAKLKKYVDAQTGDIPIGEGMRLGYIAKEERNFDTLKTHALLMGKNIDPELIYSFTTMTKSNVEKLLLKAKTMLTTDELDSISRMKRSNEFGVLTD